jgi:kumamolisin
MIRRLSISLLTLALLATINIAAQAQLQFTRTRHTRDAVINREAPLVGRMPANQSVDLTFVLPLRNEAGLDAFLADLYDPSSPNFRHYLTVEQFTAKYGPSQKDYDTLTQWAKQNGFNVTLTSRNRLILQVKGSVASVEHALHVNMNIYQHPTENRTFYAPDREPMTDMAVQLYSIGGLDTYSLPHPALKKIDVNQSIARGQATTGSCPGQAFCGSDMRAAYYGGAALTGAGQSVGLFEFLGEDLADVTTYYKNAGQINNVPINLISVDGVTVNCFASQGCDDTEQTLDITQALGMAPGLTALNMYIGKSSTTLDDKGILNAMATHSPLDSALSCSWLWNPPDPTTDDPFFKQFATQGQNFFVAAGDNGKWPGAGFYWPADDPNIVSVGGTDLTTTGPGGAWAMETGWVDSGGGISPDNFAIPSWQVTTANGCTDCSKTVRNGPDVAANANFTFYVCADQTTCTSNLYGGTSFATPMWAGYLALANEQAVSKGQPTLGFINPALYTIGLSGTYNANFHDITSGNNGWPATKGYDLVTGWGSPNGATLINSLTTGGNPDFSISANPNTLTIKRGSSGMSTITTTISNGFNASIALTANIKAAKFNPSTIPAPGAGTSTMTLKVGANAKTGTHKLIVTGTGGGTVHTTTITVTIQ